MPGQLCGREQIFSHQLTKRLLVVHELRI